MIVHKTFSYRSNMALYVLTNSGISFCSLVNLLTGKFLALPAIWL